MLQNCYKGNTNLIKKAFSKIYTKKELDKKSNSSFYDFFEKYIFYFVLVDNTLS